MNACSFTSPPLIHIHDDYPEGHFTYLYRLTGPITVYFMFCLEQRSTSEHGRLMVEVTRWHTLRHTTNARGDRPCPQRDSYLRSEQWRRCRPHGNRVCFILFTDCLLHTAVSSSQATYYVEWYGDELFRAWYSCFIFGRLRVKSLLQRLSVLTLHSLNRATWYTYVRKTKKMNTFS